MSKPQEVVQLFQIPGNKQNHTLINQVCYVIEKHLHKSEFDITQLCHVLNMSRTTLHNKLKKATGLSASIFLRTIRLENARRYLERTDMHISQIAYKVGFKDPGYFTRCFRNTYGMTPGEWRKYIYEQSN